ncbi:uncharacterized protein [Nothobranchius furzeri]|uniref:uncharacterized protein n=1 Tax=Nothobranchius furzeri TaxID=105023 RepID=UPI003904D010
MAKTDLNLYNRQLAEKREAFKAPNEDSPLRRYVECAVAMATQLCRLSQPGRDCGKAAESSRVTATLRPSMPPHPPRIQTKFGTQASPSFSNISVSHSTQNCLLASQSSVDGQETRGRNGNIDNDCEINAGIVGAGDRGYRPAVIPARQVGTNNKMKMGKILRSHVTSEKLKQLTADIAKKCETGFIHFYERAKRYVTERYDFSENSFHRKMSKLSLTADVSYGEYSDAVQACKLKNIDTDGLYEEYGMVEAILSSPEIEGCQSEERYLKLFSKADVPLVNLRKVCAYIFSIPCSNAHTERIFSMMSSAWRNERNGLDVESVKAELQICVNFTLDCTDMYKKFLSSKKLLEAARKGQKYKK